MATVILDFDSTVIASESLETILENKLKEHPELQRRIKEITQLGIRGKIPFADSLAQRLALAAPTRQETEDFGRRAVQWITPGMASLVQELQQGGAVQVWIVSGGIQESLEPVARQIGVPSDKVHGVKVLWNSDGYFLGLDPADLFRQSKSAGAAKLAQLWSSPSIVVGDAMSDYELYAKGLAQHFILFTQHFQCQEVRDKGVVEAQNVDQLRKLIKEIIEDHALFG